MHILVIDGNHVEAEFREKFGPGHEYTFLNTELLDPVESWEETQKRGRNAIASCGAVFRFGTYSIPGYLSKLPKSCSLFVEASSEALLLYDPESTTLFGFCGLPTLLNRPLLEISLYDEADRQKLAETCAALDTDYRVVEDRVGLVTPRVVCMIINEACYTLQEGTATMQDIDLGMKLGTNYPRGPFAWANAIGVERVYAVLEAMWHDTHDERYKVCPLLKRQAVRGENFKIKI
jgi:3-hydroxybutyryl-CoA dehydrogenase